MSGETWLTVWMEVFLSNSLTHSVYVFASGRVNLKWREMKLFTINCIWNVIIWPHCWKTLVPKTQVVTLTHCNSVSCFSSFLRGLTLIAVKSSCTKLSTPMWPVCSRDTGTLRVRFQQCYMYFYYHLYSVLTLMIIQKLEAKTNVQLFLPLPRDDVPAWLRSPLARVF